MKRKLSELEVIRHNKMNDMRKNKIDPYPIFDKKITHSSKELKEKFKNKTKEELSSEENYTTIGGRVMLMRGPFIIIQDQLGQIQGYINKNDSVIKFVDIGDWVLLEGSIMKTNTGEVTIRVERLSILAKSLKPLPEKFHGLVNVEERYRKRYLDLTMNPASKDTLIKRTKIIKLIRFFFDELNYLEVDTPVLQSYLGGASAKPFITHHNALSRDFYLRIATEIPLKKLIIGGIERVYEIGRLFRNEGIDTTHNPEFTSIEFYETYSNLEGMMNRVEEVFQFVAKNLNIEELEYKGEKIDFSKKFIRLNMLDAIYNETNIDFKKIIELDELKKLAIENDIKIETFYKAGHIINCFFEKFVENKLNQPTFIYNYPIEISPLAFTNKNDSRFTDRAELFICGKEYANLYTELNDPIEQFNRFKNQIDEKELGNDEANELDYDFIEALEYGMPPTGGAGIGIDRMVMLFTNQTSIREVIAFPHLKDKSK